MCEYKKGIVRKYTNGFVIANSGWQEYGWILFPSFCFVLFFNFLISERIRGRERGREGQREGRKRNRNMNRGKTWQIRSLEMGKGSRLQEWWGLIQKKCKPHRHIFSGGKKRQGQLKKLEIGHIPVQCNKKNFSLKTFK